MSEQPEWNEEQAESMREQIRYSILGEVRLNRRDEDELIEHFSYYLEDDEIPDHARPDFEKFIAEEVRETIARIAQGSIGWPAETDCERLDRVEESLREAGILFWQASPCCDNCTLGELQERIDVLEERYPGFEDELRGYSFFIDQNLPDNLAETTKISVYLAYGWIPDSDEEIPKDEYQALSLGIAREVCRHLQDEGFEVDWDGSISKKIGISLNWQRRERLI